MQTDRYLSTLTIALTICIMGCEHAMVPLCTDPERTGELPAQLVEVSGVVASRQYPGILWVHEDSDRPPLLTAIDSTGVVLGEVRVGGARNVDWEDVALGPCPAGSCIYLADTGDNRLDRNDLMIYRFPEPSPTDGVIMDAEAFPIRLPSGPRDIEALYLLPDGTPYLISKGRRHPVELYRYPLPLRPGEDVTLEEVQRFTESGSALPDQITGADASADGRWVVVRSYSWIRLYRPDDDGRLTPLESASPISLDAIAEPQGEGVALREDGTIFLVSEAGPPGVPGVVGRIECRLEDD